MFLDTNECSIESLESFPSSDFLNLSDSTFSSDSSMMSSTSLLSGSICIISSVNYSGIKIFPLLSCCIATSSTRPTFIINNQTSRFAHIRGYGRKLTCLACDARM